MNRARFSEKQHTSYIYVIIRLRVHRTCTTGPALHMTAVMAVVNCRDRLSCKIVDMDIIYVMHFKMSKSLTCALPQNLWEIGSLKRDVAESRQDRDKTTKNT